MLARKLLIAVIKRRLKAQGYSEAEINKAIKLAEGDRPLIDWLMNGGLEQLLKFIASLISLFADTEENDPEEFASIMTALGDPTTTAKAA